MPRALFYAERYNYHFLKDKYPNFEVGLKCILMVYLCLGRFLRVRSFCATFYAIVNDRLSALEIAITPNMSHDGWANVVTLSNIHERSLFTSRLHLYKNTEVSMETP